MIINKLKRISLNELNCDLDPYQSPFWAKVKSFSNWSSVPFSFELDKKGHSLLVLLKKLPLNYYIAYAPQAPQIELEQDKFLHLVAQLGEKLTYLLPKKTLFIRFDLPFGYFNHTLNKLFFNNYSVMVEATVRINLEGGYEKIREGYKKRAIRNLKKEHLKFKVSKEDSQFENFYSLYESEGKNQSYSLRSKEYLKHILNTKESGAESKLFLVYDKDTLVAASIILIGVKGSYYLYGTTKKDLDYPASYHLQDFIIKHLSENNLKFYDLMGISGPNNRNQNLKNLDLFKKSFGGEVLYRYPSSDYIIKPALHKMFVKVENYRYKKHRLV